MADVINFTDRNTVSTPGEPVPDVVECLKKLLAAAEAGKITCLLYARMGADNTISHGYAGASSTHHVVASAAYLYEFVLRSAVGADSEEGC